MKLFYFNPNTYGGEFFVMSKSKESALENLKKYLKEESVKEGENEDWYKEEYGYWKDATMDSLPFKYTIEEYEEGKIIESEIA